MAAFWSDAWLHIGPLQPGIFLVQRTSYVFWAPERNCIHKLPMCLALGGQMGISREVGHRIVRTALVSRDWGTFTFNSS